MAEQQQASPPSRIDPHRVVRDHTVWMLCGEGWPNCDEDTHGEPFARCAACDRPWRGTAEDGGCEARRLALENLRLEWLLCRIVGFTDGIGEGDVRMPLRRIALEGLSAAGDSGGAGSCPMG